MVMTRNVVATGKTLEQYSLFGSVFLNLDPSLIFEFMEGDTT